MRGPTRARLKSTFGVAVAAAAVLVMSAAPASADPVRGEYVGHKQGTESKIKIKKGSHNRELTTSLLRLKVANGQELLTYCIEINTRVQKVGYPERGWSETTLGDKARNVNWVLHHSYPYLGLGELAKGAGLSGNPSVPDAVAGTQAAIWHYSDGYNLRLGENRPAVEAIYAYL
ncbi:MAG: thioester domain-containing protein, partial [Micromonosporaceae bacterium]